MDANYLRSPALGYLADLHVIQYLQTSSFRHQAWRWQAALRRASGQRMRRPHFDKKVSAAVTLLKKLAACESPAAAERVWDKQPAMQQALNLWLDGGWPKSRLEAWLLTGEPVALVAARTKLDVGVVENYRQYFFDVAERSQGSILAEVICIYRREHSPEPYLFRVVKLLAYQGGRYLLEACLELDLPKMKPVGLADVELSFKNPTDRTQLIRAALASTMIELDTAEQIAEFVAFCQRNYEHLGFTKNSLRLAIDLDRVASTTCGNSNAPATSVA